MRWRIGVRIVAGLLSMVPLWPAAVPVISGDSARGQKLFEGEQCVRCHSINGRGGKMGADFGRVVNRNYTPAQLASTMWNHAPVMWSAMETAKIAHPKLSPEDAADLFAFFYSARFFDKPADAVRGKAAFAEKHCVDCHGLTDSRGENAPPIAKWESLADPIVMVQQMWNHSSHMQAAFARRKIVWQQLTTEQLNDMLAYLRSLPEIKHLTGRFSNTSDRGGALIFEAKGCVKCHTGNLALEDRLHGMTLTDIAVDMWNHAPRMVNPTPSLTEDEMRQLLSFLWMRQFVQPSGDVAKGQRIFTGHQCAGCHAGGDHGAPQLPGQAHHYSEVTIISAIWRHGPQMLGRMKEAGIAWPRFGAAQELVDLLAYLNSVQ
jgi:mono/diheme cytochrome c family protein